MLKTEKINKNGDPGGTWEDGPRKEDAKNEGLVA